MDALLFNGNSNKQAKVIALTGAGISKTARIPTFEEIYGTKDKLSVEYKNNPPDDFQKALNMLKNNVKGKTPTITHKLLAVLFAHNRDVNADRFC